MRKVIQWATGSVGRTTLRRIIDHPDLELVGLLVHDPKKIGLDAGEIAKRPRTGIRATSDIEEILKLEADVVIDASLISIPYEKQNANIGRLLASGKNVISPNGFFVPGVQSKLYYEPLHAAALAGNATLAGIGLNPGFIAERLAVMLTGMVANLDAIRCTEVVDASPSPSPGLIFDVMGFGTDPAQKDVTKGPIAQLYNVYYAETITFVAEAIGTTVDAIVADHEVTLAPQDIRIKVGTVPCGTVAATTWRWHATFSNGCRMTHAILWTASHQLHGEAETAHWRIEIDGRPSLRLSFALHDSDPTAPPSRPAIDATAAVIIRAIPDVCAAEPGFFQLPRVMPFSSRLV